ncbi:MAG TPA: hypothetical protein HA358_04805 [Candidatus Poseidoniaceae archaeon]|nr:hypothetical protein [Candidatus Poseidoniaceae archaeon]
MRNIIQCSGCGASIDIAGATPRIDGIKVWCRVCGTVTIHFRDGGARSGN